MDDDSFEGQPIRYLGDVQKLNLAPGDVLVISLSQIIDDDAAARMRELVRKRIPGDFEVLILSDGVRVGIISRTESVATKSDS